MAGIVVCGVIVNPPSRLPPTPTQVSHAVYMAAEEAGAAGSRGRKRTADDTDKTGGWV